MRSKLNYRMHRRERIEKAIEYKRLHPEKNIAWQRKVRGCAKVLCKSTSSVEIVKIVCRVCGNEFGMIKCDSDYLDRVGTPRKYCSSKCYGISMTKKWREQSPYAKKINNLLKTV